MPAAKRASSSGAARTAGVLHVLSRARGKRIGGPRSSERAGRWVQNRRSRKHDRERFAGVRADAEPDLRGRLLSDFSSRAWDRWIFCRLDRKTKPKDLTQRARSEEHRGH